MTLVSGHNLKLGQLWQKSLMVLVLLAAHHPRVHGRLVRGRFRGRSRDGQDRRLPSNPHRGGREVRANQRGVLEGEPSKALSSVTIFC